MNDTCLFRRALLETLADDLVLSEAGADAALTNTALILSKRLCTLALDPMLSDEQALFHIREICRALLLALRERGL